MGNDGEGGELVRKIGITSASSNTGPQLLAVLWLSSLLPPSFLSIPCLICPILPHPSFMWAAYLGDPRTPECSTIAAVTTFSCEQLSHLSWFPHRLGMLRTGLAQGPSGLGPRRASERMTQIFFPSGKLICTLQNSGQLLTAC